MSTEPERFTAHEFAKRECAWTGHEFSEYVQHGSHDPRLVICTRCGTSWTIEHKIEDPEGRVKIHSLTTIRSAHRSTVFQINFDISNLMDEEGHSLVEGEDLRYLLIEYCKNAIDQTLDEARKKIPKHP